MSNISSERYSGFGTTRWSIASRAVGDAEQPSAKALGELCADYWYPVYAYLRSSGHAPAIARDIARRFLGDLVQQSRGEAAATCVGHFRRFLLDRLAAFLGRDWRDTEDDAAAGPILPDIDIEARFRREQAFAPSPEQAFQRAFAFEVLSRALSRLSHEAEERGHADMYVALSRYLVRDPAPAEHETLTRALHLRPLAISIALKRLRQRFREIADEELADVVTGVAELASERQTLLTLLRQRRE
jgi:RNA polymerase sigma-70 factor (ECF subfamily)